MPTYDKGDDPQCQDMSDCREEILTQCITANTSQDRAIRFLGCVDAPSSPGDFNITAQRCASKHGVDYSAAVDCAAQKFDDLTQRDINRMISAEVAETPWAVVDGQAFGGSNVSYVQLLAAICKANTTIAACHAP